jgi:hypothetical protein
MDSNDISTVSEHKHLALVISDNGSWEKHIDMITGKAYKRNPPFGNILAITGHTLSPRVSKYFVVFILQSMYQLHQR